MAEDERISDIARLLWRHAHPSLKKTEWLQMEKLAKEVFSIAAGRNVLWSKWDGDREKLARQAAAIWFPINDLVEGLNALPGPKLTKVDVEQRIRDIREERYGPGYPNPEVEAEALAVYAEEKAKGTEFVAILGHLEEWYWGEEERRNQKAMKEYQEQQAEKRRIAEARLRNGADCNWTPLDGMTDLHCCKNGRLYRLRALKPDNKHAPAFEVQRVDRLDAKKGRYVGSYRTRGDATKAVANIAWREDDL